MLYNMCDCLFAGRRKILMKFRPLHERAAIRRAQAISNRRAGSSFLTVKEKPQEGKAIAVGPRTRNERGKLIPLDVKADPSGPEPRPRSPARNSSSSRRPAS